MTGPLNGMHEDPTWLWASMLLAEAEGRERAALRLQGAIEASGQRGLRMFGPVLRRYQPVADRLRARAGPALAAALMDEGAAMSPAELAAQALATADDTPMPIPARSRALPETDPP